jgi:hypothetical protein
MCAQTYDNSTGWPERALYSSEWNDTALSTQLCPTQHPTGPRAMEQIHISHTCRISIKILMFIQAVNCTISTVCVYSVVAFFEIHITVNKTAMLFFCSRLYHLFPYWNFYSQSFSYSHQSNLKCVFDISLYAIWLSLHRTSELLDMRLYRQNKILDLSFLT